MIHYKLYQINNNIYKKINVHIFIFNKYIDYIKKPINEIMFLYFL